MELLGWVIMISSLVTLLAAYLVIVVFSFEYSGGLLCYVIVAWLVPCVEAVSLSHLIAWFGLPCCYLGGTLLGCPNWVHFGLLAVTLGAALIGYFWAYQWIYS